MVRVGWKIEESKQKKKTYWGQQNTLVHVQPPAVITLNIEIIHECEWPSKRQALNPFGISSSNLSEHELFC